tara:strand:- start:699 stop:1493 length:795 start_codon:yes stop_codon:yes gene_type:complete
MPNLKCTRWAAPLGAVVHDVDVRNVSEADHAELNRLFCEHQVLVFRDQQLTPDDQMAFAGRWGKLVRHPYASMASHPDVIELSNHGKRRDINQHWHSDMTYNESPPKLTMLYAREAPELGGDTAFANQELAYNDLSQGLKDVLSGLTALHSAAGLAGTYGADAEAAPKAEHPVVRVHDETGRRSLYVCRAFTRSFRGWTRAESRSLLQFLFEHSVREEYQARHAWRTGDLVMWDNRAVLHFAVHDHGDDPRVIHRVQVEGPIPA